MKQYTSGLLAIAGIFLLVVGVAYSRIRQSRLILEERLLNDEGLTPPGDSELNLPEKHRIRKYFAYADVTKILYPYHPQNTADKWHQTDTPPEELIQLMKRFRVLMGVVRDREGDMEPSHDYWKAYWHKRDRAKLFLNRHNTSWAWAYQTFYHRHHQVRLIKYHDQYEVESGMHRAWLAKKMGFDKLPAWVEEYFDA